MRDVLKELHENFAGEVDAAQRNVQAPIELGGTSDKTPQGESGTGTLGADAVPTEVGGRKTRSRNPEVTLV